MNDQRQALQDRDVVRNLRELGRLRPDPERAQASVNRAIGQLSGAADEASAGSAGGRRQLWNWGLIMSTTLGSAAAGIVIATLLFLAPTSGIAAPTWNDVLKQAEGVRSAELIGHVYEQGELVDRSDLWVQAPSTIRSHDYELVDGKPIRSSGSITTRDGGVRFNFETNLANRVEADNPYITRPSYGRTILAVLGLASASERGSPEITINEASVEFAEVDEDHPYDQSLRGFALKPKQAEVELPPPFDTLVYWFDDDNKLRRLSMTSARRGAHGEAEPPMQWRDISVTLDPKVPNDWFAPRIPPGFHDVGAGVRPRFSEDVRKVYDAIAEAREAFGDYRAVIWRSETGGWPSYREARRGDAWRADMIDWGVLHSAMVQDNEPGYVPIAPTDPMDKLWQQVTREDYELESTVIKYGDGPYAIVNYDLAGRGPRVSARLHESLIESRRLHTLRQAAWPEWVWTENLHPHGWDLRVPPLEYRLLPPDPDRPGLIDVVGERDHGNWGYVRYTFDRSRDYLCIRREFRRSGDQAHIWEVTAFDQTDEGRWYPKEMRYFNHVYRYVVDTSAPADEAFFAWPEAVPQPTEPSEELQSLTRRGGSQDPADDNDDEQELPKTAMGKFQMFQPRGLPRGFDDKAEADAHSEMVWRMGSVESALAEYAFDHDWTFPEDLQVLVDEGYLEAEKLENPMHPDAAPPYGYIRPDFDLPNRLERMVLHEPFDEWPGVVTVVFQDGSVEHIHDEAGFERLLEEATSPEPPSRDD